MAKIFISYNAKDRTWAHWIGVTLRDNGHVPFVHEWEIGAGENIPHWMNEKLKLADRLLGVFTDAYTAAIYSGAERDAAFWEDPKGSKGFLVPVEVETVTDWPPLVKPLKRLSLVGLNEADAEKALVAFLTPPVAPKERPPFPGRHTFADKRTDLDEVFKAAEQANIFAHDSEPLPASRPALPEGRRPELNADEQKLWANAARSVEPLRPGGPPEPPPPDGPPPAAADVPDPHNREAFQKWLEMKPREWSVAIIGRAALRVLPFAFPHEERFASGSSILLSVLRATAIARFAMMYPNGAIETAAKNAAGDSSSTASSTEDGFVRSAIHSATYAAFTSYAEAPAASVRNAINYTYNTLLYASAALTNAIRQDAALLGNAVSPAFLAREPLWQVGEHGEVFPSARIGGAWIGLQSDLHQLDQHWEIWTDWYDEVLAGSPPSPVRSEAWEAAFTDVQHPSYPWEGPLPWDDGPEAVNLAIAARLDAVQAMEAAAGSGDSPDEIIDGSADPQPIPSVASPIPIVQRPDGRITAEAGALPELPPPLLEDLARTLAACRTQAERLRSAAKAPSFNGRLDYGESLDGYLEWLPTYAGTGNILLADSEARVLNKLFTADEAILATGFASRLSVFLENHIGLRAHYDEVERHYQAVRTGRVEAPLQRDAVEGIKQVVHDNTPAVFDESVPPVVDATAKPVPEPAPLAAEDLPPPDPSRPKPPRDPIADVDPRKSRNYIFAAAANRIWQILLQGKDVPTAIEGWRKTYEQMKPHMGPILEWLRVFTGG